MRAMRNHLLAGVPGSALKAVAPDLAGNNPTAPSTSLPSAAVRIKGAAQYLDCGRATIHRLVRQGELRPRKIGRATVFLVSDLDALLQRAAEPGAVKARVVQAAA